MLLGLGLVLDALCLKLLDRRRSASADDGSPEPWNLHELYRNPGRRRPSMYLSVLEGHVYTRDTRYAHTLRLLLGRRTLLAGRLGGRGGAADSDGAALVRGTVG